MKLDRRAFLSTSFKALALSAAPQHRIRFATSGYIWHANIEEGIRTSAQFGFQGIEPFREHILKYLDRPQQLKKQLDAAGISLVTCSNGGNMSVDFIDPVRVPPTIDDHVRFIRDFITPFGCRHFKINLGRRPQDGPTSEQLKIMAGALNELGKRTSQLGLRLAPHPHIWSPLEREPELRRVMELTDPEFVYLVTDTAHLTLGGMNPLRIMTDYFSRIAAVHFKDAAPKYRDYRGTTPTREEHRKANLYKNLGAGGVDFPESWVCLGDGTTPAGLRWILIRRAPAKARSRKIWRSTRSTCERCSG